MPGFRSRRSPLSQHWPEPFITAILSAETHTRQDFTESVFTTGIFHDNLGEDISIPNGSDKYSHIKEYGASGLVLQAANIQPDNMLNP